MNKNITGVEGRSGIWEMLFVVVLVLLAAVALAGQGGPGEQVKHEKRVTIRGKHVDKRAIESLADDSEDDVEIDTGPKTIISIKGQFKIDHSKPVEEAAVDFIDRHRNAFGLKNPKEELKLLRKEAYKEGDAYIHLQQIYNGVPVWQKLVTVHLDKNGDINRIGSGNVPTPDIDTTPLITEEEAVEIVRADKAVLKKGDIEGPITHLYIREYAGRYNLAYNINVLYHDHSWDYWIDAKTGKIISNKDTTHYDGAVDATGRRYLLGNATTVKFKLYSTHGAYYFTKKIPSPGQLNGFVWSAEKPLVLNNVSTFNAIKVTGKTSFSTNGSISAFDALGTIDPDINSNVNFVNTLSFFDPFTPINNLNDSLTSGVQLIDNHKRVYDYFNNTFGMTSWLNPDSGINSLPGVANALDGTDTNRSYNNGRFIKYGPGDDGITRTDITRALDVAGHEIGHSLSNFKINSGKGFDNNGHAATINEHFSDLWAMMVDTRNFLFGEDSFNPQKSRYTCRRNFANPQDPTQWSESGPPAPWPDNMNGFYYTTEPNPYLNVGIPNKAAFRLITTLNPGGGFYNYSSGRKRVAKLYYRAYDKLAQIPDGKVHFLAIRDALLYAVPLLSSNDLPDKPAATLAIFSAFSSVGIGRKLQAETIRYDNNSNSQLYPGGGVNSYTTWFIPQYRDANTFLEGAKIAFSATPGTTGAMVTIDVQNQAGESYFPKITLPVTKFDKLSFFEFATPLNDDIFKIVVTPSTNLSLWASPAANNHVYNMNYDSNDNVVDPYNPNPNNTSGFFFRINPVIIYDDHIRPFSSISSIADDKQQRTSFNNNSTTLNKAYFTNNSTVTITGHAFDNISGAGSGVKKVTLTINSSDSTPVYNFNPTPDDLTNDATWQNWQYTWKVKDLTDGRYTITSVATDMADNVQDIISGVTLKVDRSAPVGTIAINNGAAETDKTSVMLTLSASETGKTVTQMCISNDASFSTSVWEDYAATKAWTLPPGNVAKTVYVKFKDNTGNESDVFMATINLYKRTG